MSSTAYRGSNCIQRGIGESYAERLVFNNKIDDAGRVSARWMVETSGEIEEGPDCEEQTMRRQRNQMMARRDACSGRLGPEPLLKTRLESVTASRAAKGLKYDLSTGIPSRGGCH